MLAKFSGIKGVTFAMRRCAAPVPEITSWLFPGVAAKSLFCSHNLPLRHVHQQ